MQPMPVIARLLGAFVLLMALGRPAGSTELPAPGGEILLTVSGTISSTNVDGEARFDRAMLEALPAVEFTTTTIWTSAPHRFRGVRLRDLLSVVGSTGMTLRAVALNEYSTRIPVTDAVTDGPIIAYAMDGAPMSVRDKGPLWVIYPYDSKADYRTETIYARSIWQLVRIDVLD